MSILESLGLRRRSVQKTHLQTYRDAVANVAANPDVTLPADDLSELDTALAYLAISNEDFNADVAVMREVEESRSRIAGADPRKMREKAEADLKAVHVEREKLRAKELEAFAINNKANAIDGRIRRIKELVEANPRLFDDREG